MPGADVPLEPGEALSLLRPLDGAAGAVLAVSGGADSTALTLLAARWREAGGGVPLVVGTVDHGLRPEAAAECAAVAGLAAQFGLPCRILRWQGDKPASRLQERARAARHALLAGLARETGADTVVTAHTLDDQAETVLMRLARGSGLDGLAGMRPRSVRDGITLLRPLLGVPKRRLTASLRAAGIGWIEDPSNADRRFERVRIREKLGDGTPGGIAATRLAALAERVARACAALEAGAEALSAAITVRAGAPPAGMRLEAAGLLAAPADLRLRALRLALERVAPPRAGGYPLRLERLERLEGALAQAVAEGRPLRRTLAGAIVAFDGRGSLTVEPEGPRRRGGAALTRAGP